MSPPKSLSASTAIKVAKILSNLARYECLLLPELHSLCAPQYADINNFYPILRRLEEFGFIRVFEFSGSVITAMRADVQRKSNNTLYQISMSGYDFLKGRGELSISVLSPKDGYVHDLVLPPPRDIGVKFLRHSIYLSQCLSFFIQTLAEKGYANISYSSDYMLKKLLGGEVGKVPDFFVRGEDGSGRGKFFVGECERTKKKSGNRKKMVHSFCEFVRLGYEIAVFYPTNETESRGYFLAHKQILRASIKKFAESPVMINFFKYEILATNQSNKSILKINNLEGDGYDYLCPNLYSLIATSLNSPIEGWASEEEICGNNTPMSLLSSFQYFITKKDGYYIVAPVVSEFIKTYEGDTKYVGENIIDGKAIGYKNKLDAFQKAVEFIENRYGKDRLLSVLKISANDVYKSYLKLQKEQTYFLENSESFRTFNSSFFRY